MTISVTTARVQYSGSGSTGPFSIPFEWSATTELIVTKTVTSTGVETTLAVTTDYTATGSGTESGSITLVSALAAGETLVIERRTSLLQETAIARGGKIDASVLENDLDQIHRALLDDRARLARMPELHKDDTDGSGAFNARGNKIANLADGTAAADAATYGQLTEAMTPTLAVGTVTTGNAGTSATASITGTTPDFTINFAIPRGDTGATGSTGATGPTGPAGTIEIGTVTTGSPGSSATVTNVGTSTAAILDIEIPRGNTGANGSGSGDMLAANNLSDVADAATARGNLGLEIGADVQAYDADLAALAALSSTGIVRRTGAATFTTGTSVATSEVADDAITYAKMQNISATSRILGRKTSGAGDTEECTLSEILDFIGSAAQGDILYRDSSGWARLGAGTSGHYLQTQGAADNPQWAAAAGFASGTRVVFHQTSAPTGWTKETNASYNDKAIRIVTGTISSGGSNSFTTAMVSSFNSGATTLNTTQIPAHTHSAAAATSINNTNGGDWRSAESGNTGSAGGGGSHTHTVQLNVAYHDVIIAQKD
jgi:hypothetical protein